MVQQVIKVGTEANDGTGDNWRDAFIKVNANETELFANLADQAQNITVVNSESDFPIQDATTITLEANKKTFIGDSFSTAKAIIPSEGSSLCSVNPFSIQLTYTGTGNMFQSTNVSWQLCDIGYNCASGTIFSCTGTAANTVLIADSVCLSTVNVGSFTGMNTVIQNSAIFGITGQGITTFGAINILSIIKLRQATTNSAHIALDLGTAAFDNLEVANYEPEGPSGSVAIKGLTSSANINSNRVATVNNSTLNGGDMVALSGVANTDVRWLFNGNSGVGDTQPDALASFNSNATETVISASSSDGSNAVVIAGTWIEVQVSHFTTTAAGRFTYIGERDLKGPVDVSVGLISSGGGAITVEVYIALNGVPIIASGIDVAITGTVAANLSIPWQLTFSENDFIEIVVENQTNTTNVIVDHAVMRVL